MIRGVTHEKVGCQPVETELILWSSQISHVRRGLPGPSPGRTSPDFPLGSHPDPPVASCSGRILPCFPFITAADSRTPSTHSICCRCFYGRTLGLRTMPIRRGRDSLSCRVAVQTQVQRRSQYKLPAPADPTLPHSREECWGGGCG
ncbi:hypothetical protein BO99DRAFT_16361 [Aspergillus violaceofuscus CBS 115571]|uniref:Uncharacterized protein n=1 Tax=Aspergillus violaceofuscus (strain CBS 115571) TaxID=1450538 RepID=A0A2V5GTC8_ASPV1|nr:hypothetical protein BO99DRAFT_16361 [Aspergillus violaceofuscus CBS 115571]